MNKRIYAEKLVEHHHSMLERAKVAKEGAQEDANQHMGRIESRYDTFREEAQYLAGGHEARCLELETIIFGLKQFLNGCKGLDQELDCGAPGALVTLVNGDDIPASYLLTPHGGGISLELEELTIQVISTKSPLGSAILGKKAGEEIVLSAPGGQRTVRIISVC
ncbi:MAG: GreA/GreB family elongation factor [Candidatus Hydrogenedentes bacterium]|nr:GreA/GreB family elongation factor [Candidatus Hydrogenedentota bacterium]